MSDPELSGAFASLAASTGDSAVFDRLVANIEQATSPGMYERNVEALGHFSDSALVQRALAYALSTHVDMHLAAHVIGSALEDRGARPAAWPFVKSRWKDIVTKIGLTEAVQTVMDAAATFCDTALRDDVRAFFSGKGLSGEVDARLERIQSCIDFRSAQSANFERWLSKAAVERRP